MVTDGESDDGDAEADPSLDGDTDGSLAAIAARRAVNRSRRLSSRLTQQQWDFALAYASTPIARGARPDPTAAARAAGYASPAEAARRLLLTPHVAAVIGELAASDLRTRLPIAVSALVDLIQTAQDEGVRLKAIEVALKLGMAPPQKPKESNSASVNVQINNEAGPGKGQGQALIREVWRDRLARPPEPHPIIEAARLDAARAARAADRADAPAPEEGGA